MKKRLDIPRIMLAAAGSGSGKTTVMCALLRLLTRRGMTVAAFKSGPDYIDPMFHQAALSACSHNLDPFLFGRGETGNNRTRYVLAGGSAGAQIAVIEGAMGYYDGVGTGSEASAYAVAGATDTPVILVVNGRGAGISLAAQIRGFAAFRRDSRIAGFVVNHIRPMVYQYFKGVWERETGLPALGYMPELPACSLASRHLGLVTAGEVSGLSQIINGLADAAASSLDVAAILKAAHTARPVSYEDVPVRVAGSVRLAVARDEAFCFYYEDSLRVLERAGAEIVPFSPIHDTALPAACGGLYLGGGYPELYARILSRNEAMRRQILQAVRGGMPCIGECGGFMYLLQSFRDDKGCTPWVGAIPGEAYMTGHLSRFGYVTLTAQEDTLLCRRGESIQAHEFHYGDSTGNGGAFIAKKSAGTRQWPCIHSQGRLFAGYPHIHFLGNPDWGSRFVQACCDYKEERAHENRTHPAGGY